VPQLTGHFTPGLHGERLERIIASLSSVIAQWCVFKRFTQTPCFVHWRKVSHTSTRSFTSHRANIPSRMATEALHILFGLLQQLL